MSATTKQLASSQSLDSFCKGESNLQTKIALMTFYNRKYSDWVEKFILLIEYFQLMAQALHFHGITISDTTSLSSALSNLVLYFFKLVNPSYLMPLEVHNSLSSSILLIVLISMILKYLLFLYTVIVAYWSYEGNNLLLGLWRWTFKTQSRIQCFLITSFWTAVIIGSSEGSFQVGKLDNSVIMGICYVLMLIEYLFSFYLEFQFDYVLPTKNFLAAKSCTTQTLTLLQKLVLQGVEMIFSSNFAAGAWVFSIVNIVFTVIKSYQCYDKIILYQMRAVLTQNKLHSIVLSLNLACFAHTFLYVLDFYKYDATFIIIVWCILAILIVEISHEIFLKRIINMLKMRSDEGRPELLVHKVTATKELERYMKLPGEMSQKIDFSYLLSASMSANRKDIFGIDGTVHQTHDTGGVFVQYLMNLSVKFPTNPSVKLYLAYACRKNPNFYLKSLKTTTELAQKRWSRNYLSASLLINEAEKTILSKYSSEKSLDLLAYMKCKIFVLDLEAKVLEQVDLNIKICNNILGDTANIGHIFNYAQEVDKCKQDIDRKIKLLTHTIPDAYNEPLLVVAGYKLILGYSQEDYVKYIDIYTQKQIKHTKHFQSNTLTKDNLYRPNNIFLVLSGEKTNCGQIVFHSNSIQNVCGGRIEVYKGTNVSTLFTPTFQTHYFDVLRRVFNGEQAFSNKRERAFMYHKEGYIREVELYFKIHPYLTQGLYLSMIIRPTNSFKEYLLIKEDGGIEGASKEVTEALGLRNSSQSTPTLHNVKVLSEELWKVNQSFNVVAKAQNKDKKPENDKDSMHREYLRALKVYTAYTAETRKVGLMSITTNEISYYDCNISLISCGSASLKVIELVELSSDGIRLEENDKSIEASGLKEHIPGSSGREYEIENRNGIDDDNKTQSEDVDCDEKVETDEMVTMWRGQTKFSTWTGFSSPTARRLLTNRFEKKKTMSKVEDEIVVSRNRDQMGERARRTGKVSRGRGNENQVEFMSTKEQNLSASKTSNTAFRSAIAINFRPKSFRAICLMFYAVIFFTFLVQVILKVVSDNTMGTLSITKGLLSLLQLRTYKMLFIVINSRRAVNNILDPNLQNGANFAGFVPIVNNLIPHKVDLKSYNKKILENIYPLNDEIKHNLFLKDIRVYGSKTDSNTREYYEDVTSFEVADEIIDAIQKLEALKVYPNRLAGVEGYNLYNFMLLNVINDYLTKSQEITDMFVESVNKERNYFQMTLNLCLIVTPLTLIGIVIMLMVIIWKQYNMEKKHMMAFIRLKPKSIKDILKRLTIFKKHLAEKDPVKFREWLESTQNFAATAQIEQESNYHKKHDIQVIKYSETRIRYSGYILKVAFYILLLIGIMLWNFFSAQNSANAIYKRQNQLEFAYHLSEIASIIYCTINEVFGSNNQNIVKGKLAKTTLVEGLEELQLIQTRLPQVFMDDETYDPVVEGLALHYNTCNPFNFTTLQLSYCTFLLSHGSNVNLLSLVTTSEVEGRTKILHWDNCDKTNISTILVCAYMKNELLLPAYALGAIVAQKVGDQVAINLENSINDAYAQRNIFLAAFSVSLAIVSLLIWLQVLRRMRDGQNDFKKVLQIFPPQLILSSFLLKNFLVKRTDV